MIALLIAARFIQLITSAVFSLYLKVSGAYLKRSSRNLR